MKLWLLRLEERFHKITNHHDYHTVHMKKTYKTLPVGNLVKHEWLGEGHCHWNENFDSIKKFHNLTWFPLSRKYCKGKQEGGCWLGRGQGVTYTCRGWSSCGGSAWARGRAGYTVATQLKVYANVVRRKRAADGRRRSRTVAAISRSHGVLWRPTIDPEINTGRREGAARLPPPALTTTPPPRRSLQPPPPPPSHLATCN